MKKLPYLLLSMFLVISFCLNNGIYAGTTGKVQGTILDSESKEPLPGVNVVIEETTFGAATDENGFYFIINIPPGTYSLKASMIGYAIATKSDVRLYVDRTTTENFELVTSAIAGEEVTITASRVPVPLDVSQTEAYISGSDIVESPAAHVDELMGYQAGIEYERNDWYKGFSIRGGDVAETDIKLDGFSLMNRTEQQASMPLSRNLIQDVQILTGGFNAEYGNLRSGLINIITKDGSYNRYSGVLEGRFSPGGVKKHFGPSQYDPNMWYTIKYLDDVISYAPVTKDDIYKWDASHTDVEKAREGLFPDKTFAGWTDWADGREHSADFYHDEWAWNHRTADYDLKEADLWLDVGAGGPLPFLKNTKFYLSGSWNRSEFAFLAPRKRSHDFNSTLKITNRIKSNMTLVFTGILRHIYGASQSNSQPRTGQGAEALLMTGEDKVRLMDRAGWGYAYSECRLNPAESRSYIFGTKFVHTLKPSTYYEISLSSSIFDDDKYHMRYTDPAIIHYISDSKTGENIGFSEFPKGFTPRNWLGVSRKKDKLNIFTFRGGSKGIKDYQVFTHKISGNIVSQVDKYNQIKAGFELTRDHINYRFNYTQTSYPEPYDTTPKDWNIFKADPYTFTFYVQDKLEWEGMILNIGLRGLSFFPQENGFGDNDENRYDNMWNSWDQWGDVIGEGNWEFQLNRTRKTKNKVTLMPRLGISHPITESAKIFFNYGTFLSMPRFLQLFGASATTAKGAMKGSGTISVPDLKWPKVTAYEIGYSQNIFNQALLQLSGYYKDYTDDIDYVDVLGWNSPVEYRTEINNQYKDIRGLEFRVERSFGRFINGWANYNYMIKSSGYTGFEYYYEDPDKAEQQLFDAADDPDEVLPSFRLNLSLRTPMDFGPGSPILGIKPLAEWRLNILYRWNSGGRYHDNPKDAPRLWRFVEKVDIQMADLYISKQFMRGGQFYINVKNVFNIKRLKDTGGSYYSSLHLWFKEGDRHGNDKYGEFDKPYIYTEFDSPAFLFYPDRRDIYFGIRYMF